jgi:amino acid adenylation domain-containing protein
MSDSKAIRPSERPKHLPLSFAQEQLWLLTQLDPQSIAYNSQVALRIRGELDVESLKRAITTIVERHEILRTHFSVVDGSPVQVIQDEVNTRVVVEDLTMLSGADQSAEIMEVLTEECRHPFDLTSGPILRFKLLRLAAKDHIFVRTIHHIATDGWSQGIFNRELNVLYDAYREGRPNPLPPLPLQYADYALRQRMQLQDGTLGDGIAYWKRQLQGMPETLTLPFARMRTPSASNQGGTRSITVPNHVTEGLRTLTRNEGVTVFMLVAAAFQVLLSRLSGQMDFGIGSPVAMRNFAQAEKMIGFFMNPVVLRTPLSPNATFKEHLLKVRTACLDALVHHHVPFTVLINALNPQRDLRRNPLFQITVNMLNFPKVANTFAGLDVEDYSGIVGPLDWKSDPTQSKFDLTLYASLRESLSLTAAYNAALFSEGQMTEFLNQFQLLLEQIVHRPDNRIRNYSLVTPKASMCLPDPCKQLTVSRHGTILDLFARQVGASPDRIAVREGPHELTYGELDRSSSELARVLVAHGLSSEIIAIYAERNVNLVSAILGVAKANAAFMILDANYPPRHLLRFLQTAEPRGFIDAAGGISIPDDMAEVLNGMPSLFRVKLSGGHSAVPDTSNGTGAGIELPAVKEDSRAYVAFTSGSTGDPKAIVGHHAPLTHFIDWYSHRFALSYSDKFAMLSGLSHDPLLRDIFVALGVGGTICIPDPQIAAGDCVAEWLQAQGVTCMHITPTLGALILETAGDLKLCDLKCICLGGEPLTYGQADRFKNLAPGATIANVYGTTETPQVMAYAIHDTKEKATANQAIPIGCGIDNVQLLVLNESGLQCGIGELGEIHVRTPYLTAGYLNDSILTAERYLINPFTRADNDRVYKTGDLGWYRSDGTVEYRGRIDDQIKLRGFRIELGEIEACLRMRPEVGEAVAISAGDSAEQEGVFAYVTAAESSSVNVAALYRHARQYLPRHMVPSAITVLSSLPRNASGKLDRKALPRPDRSATVREYRKAANPEETVLCSILSELLHLEKVGVDADFFELGGHSLMATKLVNQIRRRFGIDLPVRAIFDFPTVAELAVKLRADVSQHQPQ